MLLKKPTIPIAGSNVPLVQRSAVATSNAQTLIGYATAAGLVGNALANFINSINDSSDDSIQQAVNSGASGVSIIQNSAPTANTGLINLPTGPSMI